MRLAAIPPLITAVVYLVIGVFVLRHVRSREKKALAYSFWLFTTVYWQLGWAVVFSLRSTTWISFLDRLNYCGIVFIPIAFYHLIAAFLDAKRDYPWLKAAYALGGVFAAACWVDGWMVNGFLTYPWGFYARAGRFHPLYLIFLSSIVIRVLFLLFKTQRIDSTENNQLKLLRLAFICYLPASSDFLVNYGFAFYPKGFIFTLISISLVSYAIVKHHLFDIRLIIRKAAVYSVVTLVLTIIYVSALLLIARALDMWGLTSNLYSSAAAAALIAILVHPVQSRIQRWVNHHFLRQSLNQVLFREATSSFAHEIKHPLVNISLPAQLALSDLDRLESGVENRQEIARKMRERLTYILNQSHEAADKVEAIRELSMEEAPSWKRINIGNILTNIFTEEKERVAKAGIDVRLSIPPHLPNVLGNEHQLKMAFTNVIRNAEEAMQSLLTAKRHLDCTMQIVRDHIEVRISDSGPGIEPKDLERLFDPWFSTKGSRGMGIGLYLTQEIIHRHHGTIEVTSDVRRGTTFQIKIPV